MILGDPEAAQAKPTPGSRVTIDDVFGRVARRRPDALALIDPPNREAFTDGAPRRLTYAEADRVVAAIAARLRHMGLPTDAVIGIQLPNIVENVLTLLGVMRAGMIAAPLPLLWRRADTIAALARIGGKALITCGRVGSFQHGQFALRVAGDVFSIRYLCGFGAKLPDGIVPFDDLFSEAMPAPLPPLDRDRLSNPAAHVAAVTFDIHEDGIAAVARNHLELLSGGLGVLLEARLTQDAAILSTFAPSSFAGIALTLLPWLISGGTLSLHHPFDPAVLVRHWRDERCGTLIVPGPVAFRLAETGVLARAALNCIVAPWRAPERLAASPLWREKDIAMVDVSVFGETGFVAARRTASGRPGGLTLGPVVAPRGSADAVVVAELVQSDAGTVALRGAMVPHHAFPPGVERTAQPHLKIGRGGLVDTGQTCRFDPVANALVVTGPPVGIVSIGGYRFALQDLQDVVGRIDAGAMLAVLPDPVVGQRLIGTATDRDTVRAALTAVGLNPLVVAAFEGRAEPGTPVAA